MYRSPINNQNNSKFQKDKNEGDKNEKDNCANCNKHVDSGIQSYNVNAMKDGITQDVRS